MLTAAVHSASISVLCTIRIIDPVHAVRQFAYRHPEIILVIGQVIERLPRKLQVALKPNEAVQICIHQLC